MITVFYEKPTGDADAYLVRFEDGTHKRVLISNAQMSVSGGSLEPLAMALLKLSQRRRAKGDYTA